MFHISELGNWILWKHPWSYHFTTPVSLSWLFTPMARSPFDPWMTLFVWIPHRKPYHQQALHWQQGIRISFSPLTATLNCQYYRNVDDLCESIILSHRSSHKQQKSCEVWWASWGRVCHRHTIVKYTDAVLKSVPYPLQRIDNLAYHVSG